jgi:hypothetical protein
MAMTKAEMKAHHSEYHACLSLARQAEEEKDFQKALDWAVSSWDHIDGMLRFERKYQGAESCHIIGLLIAFRLAPLLLDADLLNAVESLMKKGKRIAKASNDNLTAELVKARQLLADAHRLWDHLERHEEIRQDELRATFGGNQDTWRWIAEQWDKMLILKRRPQGNSYRLALATQLGLPMRAKCPSCGVIAKAAQEKFLSEQMCPKCEVRGHFVLLPDDL